MYIPQYEGILNWAIILGLFPNSDTVCTFLIKSGSRSCWLAKQEAWSFLWGQKTCLVVSYWSQWKTGAVGCGQVAEAAVFLKTGWAACVQGEHGCLSGWGGWSLSWGHQPSRTALPQVAEAFGLPGQQFSTGPVVVYPVCK